jgi:hypothetical protein
LSISGPVKSVPKTFQPPSSTGFFDARRVTTVLQSLVASSALRPFLEQLDNDQRVDVVGYQVNRIEHHDLLAVVAGLGDQLFGFVKIALSGQRRGACIARHRGAAGEERGAGLQVFGVPGQCGHELRLVGDCQHSLTHFDIVEGRQQLVEPQQAHAVERIGVYDVELGIGGQCSREIEGLVLPPIDLAACECGGRGGRLGNDEPLDPVDLDDFCA